MDLLPHSHRASTTDMTARACGGATWWRGSVNGTICTNKLPYDQSCKYEVKRYQRFHSHGPDVLLFQGEVDSDEYELPLPLYIRLFVSACHYGPTANDQRTYRPQMSKCDSLALLINQVQIKLRIVSGPATASEHCQMVDRQHCNSSAQQCQCVTTHY